MSLPRGTSTNTWAKLKIASFEPSVGIELAIGIERDAEAPCDPAGDGRTQLGQALRLRVPHGLREPIHQRAANERIGGLARVALSEVDDVDATGRRLLLCLLETDERVRRLLGQHGGERHAATLAGSRPARRRRVKGLTARAA